MLKDTILKWAPLALSLAALVTVASPKLVLSAPTITTAALSDDDEFAACIKHRVEAKLFKTIHASDDQKIKLSDLIDRTMAKNKDLRQSVKDRIDKLIAAFGDESKSEEELRKQVTDLESLHEKLAANRLDGMLEARSMLTTEQKTLLAAKIKEHLERWRE